jgi:F0F1-type ATP synthase assembly protein I
VGGLLLTGPERRRLAAVWGLPGMVVGGGLLGAGIDHLLGTAPWGILLLGAAGFGGAVLQLLRAPGADDER